MSYKYGIVGYDISHKNTVLCQLEDGSEKECYRFVKANSYDEAITKISPKQYIVHEKPIFKEIHRIVRIQYNWGFETLHNPPIVCPLRYHGFTLIELGTETWKKVAPYSDDSEEICVQDF